jgi:hypothetical protein
MSQSCTVCGGPRSGNSSVCRACEEAFNSAGADPGNPEGIDLNRYATKMFPWEPSTIVPRLVSRSQVWSAVCVGLILIVVLLSFLRTPLPSCWEISS